MNRTKRKAKLNITKTVLLNQQGINPRSDRKSWIGFRPSSIDTGKNYNRNKLKAELRKLDRI